MKSLHIRAWLLAAMLACGVVSFAQAPAPRPADPAAPPPNVVAGVEVPEHYVIGPGDVLGVVFWREKELSGDVAVLPDGRITLPLLNEIPAAGLTPEQLRNQLVEAARQFVKDPTATVVVRQVNSRRVFVTGMVAKPGQYPLYQTMTVLQLIATAGGLLEYAKGDEIVIIRREPGQMVSFSFNYKDVMKKKNLHQNIDLKPGDTVVVP
ncbi:MAG TPA: polysaccharide biosynthesis/export family protein [Vicinamibacterales bacterium]|nr:polysaccharide biosynthesis/export family protein [Vicinamibacterales bacterium]